MVKEAVTRLSDIVDKAPSILRGADDETMSAKPAPGKWSKKEILGHLIDSAANNHQRFVRGQFELTPEIKYDQNNWNKFSFHQQIDWEQMVSFWTEYNKQLIEIIKRIPPENLGRQVKVGNDLQTLEFLIVDYVDHLEHHLNQIIDY